MAQQSPSADKTQSTENVKQAKQQTLETSLNALQKYGAFDLLESAIDGVQNLNPDRKARRKIFLEEAGKKEERAELVEILQLWKEILSKGNDLASMVDYCQVKSEEASALYKKNMKSALEETKTLER